MRSVYSYSNLHKITITLSQHDIERAALELVIRETVFPDSVRGHDSPEFEWADLDNGDCELSVIFRNETKEDK